MESYFKQVDNFSRSVKSVNFGYFWLFFEWFFWKCSSNIALTPNFWTMKKQAKVNCNRFNIIPYEGCEKSGFWRKIKSKVRSVHGISFLKIIFTFFEWLPNNLKSTFFHENPRFVVFLYLTSVGKIGYFKYF